MSTALRRAAWFTAWALFAALLQSFFHQPVALPLKAGVLAFAVLAAWRPYEAVLVLAGLGPVAGMLFALVQGEAGNIFVGEVVLLAFVTGWTAREAVTGQTLLVAHLVRTTGCLLALAALASALVHFGAVAAEQPGIPWTELATAYLRDYVLHVSDSWPLTAAGLFAAGVMTALGAAHIAAGAGDRRAAVLRAVIIGAAAAAAFNVLRVAEVALRRDGEFIAVALDVLAQYRFNVHYADRNAAGSVFAMVLLLTGAVAARSRPLVAMCAPLVAAGLWISGSRLALASALAAAAATVGVAIVRTRGAARIHAAAVLVAVVLGAAVLWQWYPAGRNYAAARAYQIRMELARAGLEMTYDYPLFGVGLGGYYGRSAAYAGERLSALGYDTGFSHENAHNYFIQILAELGVPMFLAFLLFLGGALVHGWRTWESAQARWLIGGLGAYLLTCLGGHPLLVAEAATPFWIALGVAAATPAETRLRSPVQSRTRRYLPAIAAIALVVTIWPRAAAAIRGAYLEHASIGFSRWQHEPDGSRYRWAGGHSTFYVPAAASAVRIPLRNGTAERRTIEVAILMDGREANRILVPADDRWRELRVLLRPSQKAAFTRVDLVVFAPGAAFPLSATASDTGGVVHVGRPIIEP